jgi:hypothetical protein
VYAGEQAPLHRIHQLHRKPRGREWLSDMQLRAGTHATFVVAPTVCGKTTFFVVARDSHSGRFYTRWAVEALAARHYAKRDALGYWTFADTKSAMARWSAALVTSRAAARPRGMMTRECVAALRVELMHGLGYDRFGAQGGDSSRIPEFRRVAGRAGSPVRAAARHGRLSPVASLPHRVQAGTEILG